MISEQMARAFGYSVLTKFTNNATWYEVIDPYGRPTGRSFRNDQDAAMRLARQLNQDWADESRARDLSPGGAW